MILERLLVAALVGSVAVAVYLLFSRAQMRRASAAQAPSDRPTLLYFRGDHCAACIVQANFVEEVERKFTDRVAVHRIDADRDIDEAARYGIFTLPTTLVVDRSGVVRYMNYGLTQPSKLVHQLASVD